MRTIKFRAWNKVIKKMAYDIQNEYDCSCNYTDGDLTYQDSFSNYFDDGSGEDRWVVMQYTGLKDKNGKEIYEGDIYREFGEISVVPSEMSWNCGCCDSVYGWATDAEMYEIIGNIYEHSYLLDNK